MNKPILVIMAAGMGSRFGGLKQMEPIDEQGHFLMDFSLYDARSAGFEKVVFIIRKEHEQIFREKIGSRTEKRMKAAYAFQDIRDLPDGFEVPEGRTKPWGTAHAVLEAAPYIDGPFAVINADDYYGSEAYRIIYDFLSKEHQADDGVMDFAMVGYTLKNTLSESGHVARGICETDASGYLSRITERTMIIPTETGAAYSEDQGQTWTDVDPDSVVSMNMWGFEEGFLPELKKGFPDFLARALKENPLKAEYYLPSAVEQLLLKNEVRVKVLHTDDRWFGMTYREDRAVVEQQIRESKEKGIYPEDF